MAKIETFEDYLQTPPDPEKRLRFEQLFAFIEAQFPELERKIAWNQRR